MKEVKYKKVSDYRIISDFPCNVCNFKRVDCSRIYDKRTGKNICDICCVEDVVFIEEKK